MGSERLKLELPRISPKREEVTKKEKKQKGQGNLESPDTHGSFFTTQVPAFLES